MRLAVLLVASVAVTVSASAQPSPPSVRTTGEARAGVGEATEITRAAALLDARRRAILETAIRLRGVPAMQALQLAPTHLDAYVASLLDLGNATDVAAPAGTARVALETRVDLGGLSSRILAVRRDQDVSFEIQAAWADLQRLHSSLSSAAAAERPAVVAAMHARYLTARAYVELTRTVPTTVGGRTIPEGGQSRAQTLADLARVAAPDLAAVHLLLGDIAVEDGQPEPAEAHYRAALALADSSGGHAKLAGALRYQGKLESALTEAREAVRLGPSLARAHAELGLVLRTQKKLTEAIVAYRDAVRLDPDLIEGHNGLAVALANSGRLNDAVAEFREIVRIDPDSTIGYYNLAYALADLDLDVESAAALREVIRINPNHYNARFNLGELFRLEEKYDDSATQFREYLRLAPDTAQNRRNIARATGYIRQFTDPDAPLVPELMRK